MFVTKGGKLVKASHRTARVTAVNFLECEELGTGQPRRCGTCKSCTRCSIRSQEMTKREADELALIEDNIAVDEATNTVWFHYPLIKDPALLTDNRAQAIAVEASVEKKHKEDEDRDRDPDEDKDRSSKEKGQHKSKDKESSKSKRDKDDSRQNSDKDKQLRQFSRQSSIDEQGDKKESEGKLSTQSSVDTDTNNKDSASEAKKKEEGRLAQLVRASSSRSRSSSVESKPPGPSSMTVKSKSK